MALTRDEAMEAGLLEKPKEPSNAPRKLCRGLRYDLKKCLLDSDCCKVDKILPRDCLQAQTVPYECIVLAREFFECKRQFVDMRKRFRGNRGY